MPEHHGCDVVWSGSDGLVGVQRKTLDDLARSIRDGRLAREVAAMRFLQVRVLLVEGRVRWSPMGRLASSAAPFTRDQLRGIALSVQRRGVWVLSTDDVADTRAALLHLRRWVDKSHHPTLDLPVRRAEDVGSRSWGVQLLQSFPLIGPVSAGNLWDHFEAVPLAWSCGRDELAAVRGIGPTRAATLWAALPAGPDGSARAPRLA